MVVREQIKQRLASFPEGVVIAASDFDVPRQYRGALVKALGQFEDSGMLKRVSRGRYYKPRQSVFGELRPSEEELVKDFLTKDGKQVGYITGTRAFAALGLTTQISSSILVGTNVSRRPLYRGDTKVEFFLQPNPIVAADIHLFRYLDALKFVKKIPAATPEETILALRVRIETLSEREKARLLRLAFAYQPYVRAQVGAIFESLGQLRTDLLETLNPISRYHLGISPAALWTAPNWNIV